MMALLSPPIAIHFLHCSSSSSSSPPFSPRPLFLKNDSYIVQCRSDEVRNPISACGIEGSRQPHLPFSSLVLDASSTVQPTSLSTCVGSRPPSPSISQWNLTPRHALLLNFTACTVAISASCLFFAAIPTLLSFKRAAESLEKLFDVTAEELPDTMAAVRLSGMEISDLTMELSDLGQEITQGVRRSTRAVRMAEERLSRFTSMDPIVSTQAKNSRKEIEGPLVAKRARKLREGIMKGRAVLGAIFGVAQVSRWACNVCSSRGQKC